MALEGLTAVCMHACACVCAQGRGRGRGKHGEQEDVGKRAAAHFEWWSELYFKKVSSQNEKLYPWTKVRDEKAQGWWSVEVWGGGWRWGWGGYGLQQEERVKDRVKAGGWRGVQGLGCTMALFATVTNESSRCRVVYGFPKGRALNAANTCPPYSYTSECSAVKTRWQTCVLETCLGCGQGQREGPHLEKRKIKNVADWCATGEMLEEKDEPVPSVSFWLAPFRAPLACD